MKRILPLIAVVALTAMQVPAVDITKTVVIIGSSPDAATNGFSESVYTAPLSLENARLLYRLPELEFGLNTALAPDGRSVVLASRDWSTEVVYVRRLNIPDGRVLSQATLSADAVEIGFTPDAKSVTYIYPTGTNWDIYAAPVSGGAARRLTIGGNVSPFAPAVIAAGRLYYCGSYGQIQSEELNTHRKPRVFPAQSYRFTVAPSGDTLVYATIDAATGAPEIDTLDTWNGFHDRFPIDDPTTVTTFNLAISQDERFVYFTNVHHGGHGTSVVFAERLNIDNGRFTHPVTGILRTESFTTTAVNPNQ